ncbi:Cactin [Chionoecetes opilio]|uniref:Cactin n=1 Tax=Chionoecetes opilio TaxID=41210 RepID=A0A8J8WB40_CHIOP|nr:Cactin [Chionoecetes opilio]
METSVTEEDKEETNVEEDKEEEKEKDKGEEEEKEKGDDEEEEKEKGEGEEEGEEKEEGDEEDKEKVDEEDEEKKDKGDEWDSDCEGNTAIAASLALYTSGRYSPRLHPNNKLEPGTVVVDEAEDTQRLAWARRKVLGAGKAVESGMTAEEKVMQREAQRSMAGDEAQFSVEARLDPQHFLWSDKYRPRKPRYFNRVHTGFEWNKYNQTHYDMDNPPPKIVQGYKFNIFYPDLIDKSKTPQYELIPCSDNRDFALLKFTAGPPYEAIAFKIVNREWEYSYKRGFRCQFHNNIFQLWFHFKRYRYRR